MNPVTAKDLTIRVATNRVVTGCPKVAKILRKTTVIYMGAQIRRGIYRGGGGVTVEQRQ